jgi:probable addiction module antidote protein
MARSKKYKDLLIKALKDPQEALAYLNAILEECKDETEESQKLLLMALKDIAEAQGGMAKLSKKTGLGRESLYKTLSVKGNPRFKTLSTLVNAMGFDLKFSLAAKR